MSPIPDIARLAVILRKEKRGGGKNDGCLEETVETILRPHGKSPGLPGEGIAALRACLKGVDILPRRERTGRLSVALEILDKLQEVEEADGRMARLLETLDDPIRVLPGIGAQRTRALANIGIRSIADLLTYYPRDYVDNSRIVPIAEAVRRRRATVSGTVQSMRAVRLRGRRGQGMVRVSVADDSAEASLLLFTKSYLFPYYRKYFERGARLIASGRFLLRGKEIQIQNPLFEILGAEEKELLQTGRIVPVYPLGGSLGKMHMLRSLIMQGLNRFAPLLRDPIPMAWRKQENLTPLPSAIRQIHFPDHDASCARARKRLVFDEFFSLQLALALRKRRTCEEKGAIAFSPPGDTFRKFLQRLPFRLTQDQEKALNEITEDMVSSRPMNRLLQGDVGTGKTIVAAAAAVVAVENGYQAAVMAPTEILADQHARTLQALLSPLEIPVMLLLGDMSARGREEARMALASGRPSVIVGTHAIIQSDIDIPRLGFAVIDEQHRFGVLQRAALLAKGAHPDVLVMTATPIPRTLALTVYGDLDISLIRTKPPGRGTVRTFWRQEEKRDAIYRFIAGEVKRGRQAFIICPRVEETGKRALAAATRTHRDLADRVFPTFRVGLVHGRMGREEKDRTMAALRQRAIDILVSTSVIEVGIDIPTATVMLIEHADTFGLSQLHQLRGRIGRSRLPGTCILMTSESVTEEARARMEAMLRTEDGFAIAEEDLLQRGPGEFLGARQSGVSDLKLANLIRDQQILSRARRAAFALVEKHPHLEDPALGDLRDLIRRRFPDGVNLLQVG